MTFDFNYVEIIALALEMEVTRSVSFEVKGYTISAVDATGAPIHLTWGQAVHAIENVFAGVSGTIQSGDIAITVTPPAAPAPAPVVEVPLPAAAPAPAPAPGPTQA